MKPTTETNRAAKSGGILAAAGRRTAAAKAEAERKAAIGLATLDAQLEAIRAAVRKIEALTGNPHWTADRRWRIAELAADARTRIDDVRASVRIAQEGGNHGR